MKKKIVYSIFQTIFKLILRYYFRWEVTNAHYLPLKGGGIIACNHTSYLDPALAGTGLPRPVYYLARNTLFKNKFATWFITKCQGIPIKRNSIDRKATKHVISLIQEDEYVVMFPEGTRSINGNIKKAKPGIGTIAWETKCNIIPCYIHDAHKALPMNTKVPRRVKIKVYYGPSIDLQSYYSQPASKELYQKISDEIMLHIQKIKDHAQ